MFLLFVGFKFIVGALLLVQVRPITFKDFTDALGQVRASVSDKDLASCIEWNKLFGSWGI